LNMGQTDAGLGVSKYRIPEVKNAVSSTTLMRGTFPASEKAAAHDDDCCREDMFEERRVSGD
jgi:hypothetical protein